MWYQAQEALLSRVPCPRSQENLEAWLRMRPKAIVQFSPPLAPPMSKPVPPLILTRSAPYVSAQGELSIMTRQRSGRLSGLRCPALAMITPPFGPPIKRRSTRLPFAHTGAFTNQPAKTSPKFLIYRAPEGTGQGPREFCARVQAMEPRLSLPAIPLGTRRHRAQQGYSRGKPKLSPGKTRWPRWPQGARRTPRAPFAPLLSRQPYRCGLDTALRKRRNPEGDFALRMANLLDAGFRALGPETVMAFVASLSSGPRSVPRPAPSDISNASARILRRAWCCYIAERSHVRMGARHVVRTKQEGIAAEHHHHRQRDWRQVISHAAVMAAQKVDPSSNRAAVSLWEGHTYMSPRIATAGRPAWDCAEVN